MVVFVKARIVVDDSKIVFITPPVVLPAYTVRLRTSLTKLRSYLSCKVLVIPERQAESETFSNLTRITSTSKPAAIRPYLRPERMLTFFI